MSPKEYFYLVLHMFFDDNQLLQINLHFLI